MNKKMLGLLTMTALLSSGYGGVSAADTALTSEPSFYALDGIIVESMRSNRSTLSGGVYRGD